MSAASLQLPEDSRVPIKHLHQELSTVAWDHDFTHGSKGLVTRAVVANEDVCDKTPALSFRCMTGKLQVRAKVLGLYGGPRLIPCS